MRKFLLAVLFISYASISTLIAQKTIRFQDVSEGLSQKTVTCTVQDSDGFLWIGTTNGLNRYDGLNHKLFDLSPLENKSTNSNYIKSLAVDTVQNILWIGTYGSGLIRMNLDDYSISTFENENLNKNDKYMINVFLDSERQLWVVTAAGKLYQIDQSFGSLGDISKYDLSSIEDLYVMNIKEKRDVLFIGTSKDGLFRYNKRTNTLDHLSSINSSIRCLELTEDGACYIGTNEGVWYLKSNASTAEKIVPEVSNFVILSLLMDAKGRLFIGTENEMLYTYYKDELHAHGTDSFNEKSISGNSIWNIFQDDKGIIWIGLYLKGLNKIDNIGEKFDQINIVSCQESKRDIELVTAFWESTDHLWIGTDGNGLFSYNKNTFNYEIHDFGLPVSKISITDMVMDKKGILWISVWNLGIIKYDPLTKLHEIITTSGRSDSSKASIFTKDLHRDNNDNIWVATSHSGLDLYVDGTFTRHYGMDKIASNEITSIANDCDGNLIIGTIRKGIQILSFDEKYNVTESKSVLVDSDKYKGYNIMDIKVDNNCNIWVATSNGLFTVSPRNLSTVHYNIKDGLPCNLMASIAIDNNNRIWVGTKKGIFSLDKDTKKVTKYDEESGLLSKEFIAKSIIKTENGSIYFGNDEGVNVYNPRTIKKNLAVPKVYITSYKTFKDEKALEFNINKKFKEDIIFEYDNNDLSFRYTALNFSLAKKNEFQIRLLGLDKNWQNVNHKRIVEYRNLKPGSYTFQVKGSNNDGVWNEKPSEFSFLIKEPWYNSWLVWILLILTVGTSILLFVKNKIAKSILEFKLVNENIKLEKLKVSDQFKTDMLKDIYKELIDQLKVITKQLQKYQEDKQLNTDYETGIMLKNTTKLESYLSYLLKINKTQDNKAKLYIGKHDLITLLKDIKHKHNTFAQSKNINIHIVPEEDQLKLYFDKEMLGDALSNILTNAIAFYDSNRHIYLTIYQTNDEVQLIVKDSNYGIKKDTISELLNKDLDQSEQEILSSIDLGLSILKQVVELHAGQLIINSENGLYSSIQIILKKGKSHFSEEDLYNSRSSLSLREGFSDIERLN
jgi:ligand-binding sensor domain-containing protein